MASAGVEKICLRDSQEPLRKAPFKKTAVEFCVGIDYSVQIPGLQAHNKRRLRQIKILKPRNTV